MQEKDYGEFIVNIMQTLDKNGFPNNKVSLPLVKMYEKASAKGLNFNKVLEFLKEKGIDHTKTTEKIIFFPRQAQQEEQPENTAGNPFQAFQGLDLSQLQNMNLAELMSTASELIKNMNPEQLAAIQAMYTDMSEEQKQELMKKAKELGIL